MLHWGSIERCVCVFLQVRGLITDFLTQTSAAGRPVLAQRAGSTQLAEMQRTSSSSQLPSPSPGSQSKLSSLFHRKRSSPTPKQGTDRRRSRLHLHKKHDSLSSDFEVQDTLRNDVTASLDDDSPRSDIASLYVFCGTQVQSSSIHVFNIAFT